MNFIEFKNFYAYYSNKKQNDQIAALNNISFDINEGELFVVVGESGSGKTTILRSILGLMNQYEGELVIDGKTIDYIETSKENFAYVRQEIALYPHMTIYDNIAFPLKIMHTPFDEIERRVNEVAKKLDISYILTRKPKHISIGQQQRVAIARAIVKKPRLILFDEPFSNLDPKLRFEFRKLIRQIHDEYGTTMIYVTHDISEAFALAERMIVLERGEIVESGTPKELAENPQSELLKVYFKNEQEYNDNKFRSLLEEEYD